MFDNQNRNEIQEIKHDKERLTLYHLESVYFMGLWIRQHSEFDKAYTGTKYVGEYSQHCCNFCCSSFNDIDSFSTDIFMLLNIS